jgi:hypothetical protein
MAISLASQYTYIFLFDIYSPPRARPTDHVEVVARLGRRVWVDSLHQLLKDHESGQAAHAAAVEGEQAQVVVRHVVVVGKKLRSYGVVAQLRTEFAAETAF